MIWRSDCFSCLFISNLTALDISVINSRNINFFSASGAESTSLRVRKQKPSDKYILLDCFLAVGTFLSTVNAKHVRVVFFNTQFLCGSSSTFLPHHPDSTNRNSICGLASPPSYSRSSANAHSARRREKSPLPFRNHSGTPRTDAFRLHAWLYPGLSTCQNAVRSNPYGCSCVSQRLVYEPFSCDPSGNIRSSWIAPLIGFVEGPLSPYHNRIGSTNTNHTLCGILRALIPSNG